MCTFILRNVVIATLLLAGMCVLEVAAEGGENQTSVPEGPAKDPYGYKKDDVTQGIGYGHHLHPFYYQGPHRRFYNCAVEDDWTPLSDYAKPTQIHAQWTSKPQKLSPKKYNRLDEVLKIKMRSSKARAPGALRGGEPDLQDRNDRGPYSEPVLKREHAKLLAAINNMSENQPFQLRLREEDREGALAMATAASQDAPRERPPPRAPPAYRVHEAPEAPVATAPRGRHSYMPFQKYRKFRVMTFHPTTVSTVLVQHQVAAPRPAPAHFRRGRHTAPARAHPLRLTMLEQFLLLFPRLI